MAGPGLLFVFDAEGGLIDRIVHSLRVRLSPAAEHCALRRLICGAMGLSPQWKRRVRELGLSVSYLHREEFRSHHQALARITLPAVFFEYDDGSLELALDRAMIARCGSMEDLLKMLHACLADGGPLTPQAPLP